MLVAGGGHNPLRFIGLVLSTDQQRAVVALIRCYPDHHDYVDQLTTWRSAQNKKTLTDTIDLLNSEYANDEEVTYLYDGGDNKCTSLHLVKGLEGG